MVAEGQAAVASREAIPSLLKRTPGPGGWEGSSHCALTIILWTLYGQSSLCGIYCYFHSMEDEMET